MTEPQPRAAATRNAEDPLVFLKKTGCEVEAELSGVSMETALPNGSAVRIRFGEGLQYSLGSVVAFRSGDTLILHRLVYSDGILLVTRGDARWFPDQPMSSEMILGQVTACQRDGAWAPPAADSHSRGRRVLQSVFLGLLLTAVKVSPRFARSLGASMLWLRRLPSRARRLLRPGEKLAAEAKIPYHKIAGF